jgi:hypothetical protein
MAHYVAAQGAVIETPETLLHACLGPIATEIVYKVTVVQ